MQIEGAHVLQGAPHLTLEETQTLLKNQFPNTNQMQRDPLLSKARRQGSRF